MDEQTGLKDDSSLCSLSIILKRHQSTRTNKDSFAAIIGVNYEAGSTRQNRISSTQYRAPFNLSARTANSREAMLISPREFLFHVFSFLCRETQKIVGCRVPRTGRATALIRYRCLTFGSRTFAYDSTWEA